VVILAAGLTPAWQQILVFERFAPGEVNRAAEAVWCASGKVLNVGSALHHLGIRSHTLSLIGGITGEAIRSDFAALGVPAMWIESSVPTRVCTTILDQSTGQTTELVENSAALPVIELERFAAALVDLARRANLIVISGSLPQGAPHDYFRRLIESLACPVLLDIRGAELLDCLPLKPWLVKPNREELSATVGRPLSTDDELIDAMQQLRGSGAQCVVVSDGPRAVWAAGPDGVERLDPPRVKVVNPIGCGDCLAAGLAVAWCEGRPWRDGLEFAVAVAAENATRLLPARIARPVLALGRAIAKTHGVQPVGFD
jgi:1-phosphofructokinase family hexose kinase